MTSLKIVGKRYTIAKAKRASEALIGHNGMCRSNQLSIHFADDLPPDEQADTVLHEVIHAVDHQMDTELTETQVRRIATGVVAVFKDNPKFYSEYIA